MPLTKYKAKRKFLGKGKTNEPEGKVNKSYPEKTIFVIHEHHASHLHWDLRLEMNGTLASWAVPKTPEELNKKGIKRLAMHVEDNPLEYASFKGTIPEGNYGSGTVEIWDSGFYELIKQTEKEIEFILHGKKLNGKFVLIKTHYGSKPDKSWLWFKTN